jgi:hypothetical protein
MQSRFSGYVYVTSMHYTHVFGDRSHAHQGLLYCKEHEGSLWLLEFATSEPHLVD